MNTGQELRQARRAADLTLAEVARRGGVSPSHLSRIEAGERPVTPATIALYQRVVGRTRDDRSGPTVGDVRRKDFLALAGATAVAAVWSGPPVDAECVAQWVAWESWTAGRDLHETEVPEELRAGLAHLLRRGHLVRTAEGVLRFPHPGLVDFHIACRVFTDARLGSFARLESAQTTHSTDLVIRELVAQDVATAGKLDRWMSSGASDVLRVNAAGILAKVGAPETVDRVIAALRVDHAMRVRYLTAVASRVLTMPWEAAGRLAQGDMGATPEDAAVRLSGELRNPHDAAARWCSAVLLHRTGAADREPVKGAVAHALRAERAPENLRTMAALLAGADPVTTTFERKP